MQQVYEDRYIVGTNKTKGIPPEWLSGVRYPFLLVYYSSNHNLPKDYIFILLLCPGDNLALGSTYTLALLTAVGASPKPTAINFSLPS